MEIDIAKELDLILDRLPKHDRESREADKDGSCCMIEDIKKEFEELKIKVKM